MGEEKDKVPADADVLTSAKVLHLQKISVAFHLCLGLKCILSIALRPIDLNTQIGLVRLDGWLKKKIRHFKR